LMFKWTMRICAASFFFAVAVHAVASAPVQGADEGQLLLFMPEIQGDLPDGLSYTVHKPYSELKPAISPTKPWETWAVFAYNSVVQYGPGEFRMYYDCVEGVGPRLDAVWGRSWRTPTQFFAGFVWQLLLMASPGPNQS